MTNVSKITRANLKTESLRATIPENIVNALKLQAGDVLDWSVVDDKGKRYARFRKLE